MLGIDLERGRPGHPQDNAGHERMHKDISRELEAVGECAQDALDLWRESFNYERPHEALGMRCPGEVYLASERKYESTPEDLDYPKMCSRRVSPRGLISLEGQPLFLSTSLGDPLFTDHFSLITFRPWPPITDNSPAAQLSAAAVGVAITRI